MLSIRPLRPLQRLTAVVVVLHVTCVAAERLVGVPRDTGLLRQFDLNAEGNATAWFGSLLLLCGAAAAAVVAVSSRRDDAALARRWTVLTALLVLMSLDETAQLHDLATGPLRRALHTEFGPFHFAWVLPGLAVVALAAFYLAPVVRSLEVGERVRLLRAFVVYVSGAVVLEMAGGFVVDVDVAEQGYSLPYLAVTTLEESLELVGAVLLLGALLEIAARRAPLFVLDLGPSPAGAASEDTEHGIGAGTPDL